MDAARWNLDPRSLLPAYAAEDEDHFTLLVRLWLDECAREHALELPPAFQACVIERIVQAHWHAERLVRDIRRANEHLQTEHARLVVLHQAVQRRLEQTSPPTPSKLPWRWRIRTWLRQVPGRLRQWYRSTDG